jgi:hypothetical protein
VVRWLLVGLVGWLWMVVGVCGVVWCGVLHACKLGAVVDVGMRFGPFRLAMRLRGGGVIVYTYLLLVG